MGTNYYHRTVTDQLCPCCDGGGREVVQTHIGKSSSGWTFSFHGTDQIRSYKAWLAVLEAGGEIRDEYGDIVTLEEFKELVERKMGEKNNHTVYCRESQDKWDRRHGYEECWVDEYGHSFSGREFS